MAFFVFFSIVLLIYGLINYYIYRRIIPLAGDWKTTFSILFWLLVLMYPAGRILEKQAVSFLSDFMIWVGAFWLAIMLYALLWVLISDFYRLLGLLIPGLKNLSKALSPELKLIISGVIVLLPVIVGYINANHPRLVHFEVPARVEKKLRLTFLSDIHLGTTASKVKIERIKALVEKSRPDLLIYGGDVLDEDVSPVERKKIGYDLLSYKAPLGVYAVTGNHEYIGGAPHAVSFLKSFGIVVLQDEWVIIDSSLIIAGSKDKDGARFGGGNRKTVHELLSNVPSDLPVLLVDHQPFDIDEKAQANIFLNLSGHTHHGQLWPLNLITRAIYEQSHGWLERGTSLYYVSCGAGTWGPPLRTSSRPEVIVIDLIPQSK